MVDYNKREIFFTLKEYKANYQRLLSEYLLIHEDFDESQFVNYELDLYDLCSKHVVFNSYYEKGVLRYSFNFDECTFLINKLYDNLVKFDSIYDGWDLELAMRYRSSFDKIIDFLLIKKDKCFNIIGRKYNTIIEICKTPEVKNFVLDILNKNLTEFSVINYIEKNTTIKTYGIFLKEFNTCFETLSCEFMFEVSDKSIVKMLDLLNYEDQFIYVNDEEYNKIKVFVRNYNGVETVFNVSGFSFKEKVNSKKLLYLNNLMIDYCSGFFHKEIDGFENLNNLKSIYILLNNNSITEKKSVSNQYKTNEATNVEPGLKGKKLPAKWHSLTYLIELLASNEKPPTNHEGSFIKTEIEAIGKIRCGDSGQSFYRQLIETNEIIKDDNKLNRTFSKDWQARVLEITQKPELIKKYLEENYPRV